MRGAHPHLLMLDKDDNVVEELRYAAGTSVCRISAECSEPVVRCSIEKWEYHVVKEFLLEKLEQSAASA